jgi:PQQ-dependent dehydrogenase (methanol/ethanol family)
MTAPYLRPNSLISILILVLLMPFSRAADSPELAPRGSSAGSPGGEDWMSVDGTPESWHYTPQTQINDSNISQLGLAWAADIASASGGLVGTPLIKAGVVYQSGPGGVVYANDGRSGKSLWTFQPPTRYDLPLSLTAFWAMHHNRGMALDDDHVYVAAGDCRLFAVDRRTGKEVWVTEACDPKQPYGITSAPRVGGGLVFMGNANADFNTSAGFVSAFDARTGAFRWRFSLRPGDPTKPFESETLKMAAKTWGKDYWPASVGGAHAWDGMTYDPKLDLLYIGTEATFPENPLERGKDAGDELFASAIVAVKAKTGEYVWHYTVVPHDGWELAAVAPIQIVEVPVKGVQTRVLMQAPKNGFFYLLDAKTGKFISAGQIATQNWAKNIDPNTGRPLFSPDAQYWNHPDQDTVVSPGPNGARTWESMAYSPKTGLVYVPTRTMATLFARDGSRDWYYPFRKDAKFKAAGQLTAWDPLQQKKAWQVVRPSTHNGGVLATAGNLVFQGTLEGKLDAFDARTGRNIWSFKSDGSIMGAPSTAVIDGVEYIFIASGDNGASAQTHSAGKFSSLPDVAGPPRLLAFSLGGKATLPARTEATDRKLKKPWRPRQPPALVAQGAKIFDEQGCSLCHGVGAVQGGHEIPDLRSSSQQTYAAMRQILDGAFRPAGMPAFKNISNEEIAAIQAYLTEQAWKGYEEQQSVTSARK